MELTMMRMDCSDCEESADCEIVPSFQTIHTGANGDGQRWQLARQGSGGIDTTYQEVESVRFCVLQIHRYSVLVFYINSMERMMLRKLNL